MNCTLVLVSGNSRVKPCFFLSFCFSLFQKGSHVCPKLLPSDTSRMIIFDNLSPMHSWHVKYVSKCGKLTRMVWQGGEERIGVFLLCIHPCKVFVFMKMCMMGELSELIVAVYFLPKILISVDVVDCVRML